MWSLTTCSGSAYTYDDGSYTVDHIVQEKNDDYDYKNEKRSDDDEEDTEVGDSASYAEDSSSYCEIHINHLFGIEQEETFDETFTDLEQTIATWYVKLYKKKVFN